MTEPMDANPSASSSLETALNGQTDNQIPQETPTDPAPSSAGTLNTSTTEQAQEEQVPWHKDRRFQQWKQEEKDLRLKAQQAEVWQRALSEHPEFARKMLGLIEEVTGGAKEQSQQPSELDPVAEKLLSSTPFRKLMEEITGVKQALSMGSKELSKQKFTATANRYAADFKTQIGDLDVHPKYQKHFERSVWEKLSELSPDSVKNYEYDPIAFKQAVDEVKQEYLELTNGIASSFTKKAAAEATPKTQKGGLTPLGNMQSEEEALKDFANQLKGLSL